MKFKNTLLNFLQVREEESKLVSRLFAFEFFQGIAIAIFFYSSITLFLNNLPTEDLAYAFILSAFMLWAAGAAYNYFEHKLPVKKLIILVVIFNAFSILFFRFGLMADEHNWFYFLMLASFNVSYLLNNLEFWGSAAMLFDVRQSKRLFSIISAGDIPAKLIGYLASVALGKALGQENILWLAFGCLIISLYFFSLLTKTGAMDSSMHHHHSHSKNPNAEGIIAIFRNEKLIRQAAFVSFFSYCAFILLNFIFFGYIKTSAVHHDAALASFIAIFLATSRAITLLVKVSLTNRIVDKLGVRNALLITPLLLFALVVFALLMSINNSTISILYLFATITIVIDVMRSAIQSPVLLATMQPLPIRDRLAGHTIIKGIMDPFAFLTIGVVVLVSFHFHENVDYRFMSIVLFVLIIGWIYWIFNVDKNYVQTLSKAIKSKLLQDRAIGITDSETQKILLDKLKTCDADEAVFILRIIKKHKLNHVDFIMAALANPNPEVQKSALITIKELKLENVSFIMDTVLNNAERRYLLPFAIGAIGSVIPENEIEKFLNDDSKDVLHAAVSSLLKEGRKNEKANFKLQTLIISENTQDRIEAANILADMNNSGYANAIIRLMNDKDQNVKRAAILSAKGINNDILLEKMASMLSNKENEKAALKALEESGPNSLPYLKKVLLSNECSRNLQLKILMAAGRIGDANAIHLLTECLELIPELTDTILRALNLCINPLQDLNAKKYHSLIQKNLHSAADIIFKLHYLSINNSGNILLYHACQIELTTLRSRLLMLFELCYNNERIKRAQRGFEIGSKEAIANAFEIIDLVVPKEFSQPFIHIFEVREISHKHFELKRTMKEPSINITTLRNEILQERPHEFNLWTKACALYELKDETSDVDYHLVESFRNSDQQILSETATFILDHKNANSKN